MNLVESGVRRYWDASVAWRRGYKAELWNYGDLIDELAYLQQRHPKVAPHAYALLQEVIRDHRSSGDPSHNAQIIQLRLPFSPTSSSTDRPEILVTAS